MSSLSGFMGKIGRNNLEKHTFEVEGLATVDAKNLIGGYGTGGWQPGGR